MDEKRKAVSSLVVVPGRDEPQSGVTFLNDTGRSVSWSEVGRLAWICFTTHIPLQLVLVLTDGRDGSIVPKLRTLRYLCNVRPTVGGYTPARRTSTGKKNSNGTLQVTPSRGPTPSIHASTSDGERRASLLSAPRNATPRGTHPPRWVESKSLGVGVRIPLSHE